MDINPILSEIQGLSPAAKGALGMAGHTLPADPGVNSKPVITPQMRATPDAGPAPSMAPITMPGEPTPQLGSSMGGVRDAPAPISMHEPRGTLIGDEQQRQSLIAHPPGVEGIAGHVEGSSFGQRHPILGKILGGISEGAGMLGDTLLHAAAPGLERMTPGTEGNYTRQLSRANAAETGDLTNAKDQAETANQTAQAGEHTETTNEMPGKEADTHALNQSEVAEHNAQATALLHPQAKTDFEAWQAQNPGKPIEDWIKAQAAGKNVKPDTPEQQYLDEYATKHPGSGVAEAERQYSLDTQRPPQAAPVNLFVPGSQPGTETLQTVRPGQTVAAGAQTAAGLNAVNTPTTQQRTAAGRAQTVVSMAPEVLSRIDALAPKLGPLEGRWNEYMQGKIGSDDPDFAALRSDLLMMSSAVALAHAQGRLPENLRLEFDNAINAPKQTPANLKATIQTMLPWLRKMQEQGQPNKAGEPQSGGTENWVRGKDGKLVKQ